MSENLRKSVSERVTVSEEIFLQPIDQHYERINKIIELLEISDPSNFFEEYEHKQQMKEMICDFEYSEVSTDSESVTRTSRNNSVKSDNNVNLKIGGSSKIISLLKDNWRTMVEDTIRNQKSLLKFLTEQTIRNTLSPFSYRTRAYSNAGQQSKFSFLDNCSLFRNSSGEGGQNNLQNERVFNAIPPVKLNFLSKSGSFTKKLKN